MGDTLLLFDRAMIGHDPGPGHPERPERLRAIEAVLDAQPIAGAVMDSPGAATAEQIARVHKRAYVDAVFGLDDEYAALDGDTRLSPGSVRAARLAAGAAVEAVDAIYGDEVTNAFAMVRPPGHHAEEATAMGFCVFNNVAIAAAHAREAHGCERILVIDWDVHHGNGTQWAFYDDPGVMFVSTHQYPFYPGTGAIADTGRGAGTGYTVNLPFAAGATDGDYAMAFREVLTPIAASYKPQLVLVSAGFDAHVLDPLGEMRLSAEGFADLCAVVKDIAGEHANGRLALMLEGGYDLEGLSRSVLACTLVLTGVTAPDLGASTTTPGEKVVRRVLEQHGLD